MNKLAQTSRFGTVAPPPGVDRFNGGDLSGISIFISVILRTLIMGAGIYALINFVLAGYSFLSAGGDPKKIQDSWGKIWYSILGLMIAAGAFVIAAVVGLLIFGDASALIGLRVFGP